MVRTLLLQWECALEPGKEQTTVEEEAPSHPKDL